MRGFSYKKYLLFGAVIVLTLSLPAFVTERLRVSFAALFSSFWKKAPSTIQLKAIDKGRLEAENHLLRIEIGKLRALIEQRTLLEGMAREILANELPLRRLEELKYLVGVQLQAIPATVIYRDPASWSASLWVDVGEATNKKYGKPIIQKNSPVLIGRSIAGVIDYVGNSQSRVRLISDTGLKPSVRALRGHPQKALMTEHCDSLIRFILGIQDLPMSSDEKSVLLKNLEKLKACCSEEIEEWHLAKGILQGGSSPIWRSVNQKLKGIGFNYDFADEEGPSLDLRSGFTHNSKPLIQVGDLLLTTGMDGVFPAGLRAAEVTKIHPLREGAFTYEIEAIPAAGNLNTIQTLFVIPPLGFDFDDEPKGKLPL